MKKLNRLKLKAVNDHWDVVGCATLTFCSRIMPKFGLEYGSDYIMSIRTTPKKTHFKVTLSTNIAGFWQWQCDAVPLHQGNLHERFFSSDLDSKELMSRIVAPGTEQIDLWIKFRKLS